MALGEPTLLNMEKGIRLVLRMAEALSPEKRQLPTSPNVIPHNAAHLAHERD